MLISLLVGLIVIALVYWALTYLPLPPVVRQIGVVLLVVLGALWLRWCGCEARARHGTPDGSALRFSLA
jgi:hypothetical protein